MFDDLFVSIPCPVYSTGYWPTVTTEHIEIHLETIISLKAEDLQLQTFNRTEPLDTYTQTVEPYDKSIVRTILRIDI